MASKSTAKRRARAAETKSKFKSKKATPHDDDYEQTLEDSLAYGHDYLTEDDNDLDTGHLARSSKRMRTLALQREVRVVVAALASGFALGALVGCVIAGTRQRRQPWHEQPAREGLAHRILGRLSRAIPESVGEHFNH